MRYPSSNAVEDREARVGLAEADDLEEKKPPVHGRRRMTFGHHVGAKDDAPYTSHAKH